MYIKQTESAHWYDVEGTPVHTIKGANGKVRPTTLRDAKKNKYYPSVTTILKTLAKPGLEIWKQNQILQSALTLPKKEYESLDDFAKRAIEDSKQHAIQAANNGKKIHGAIERFYTTGVVSPKYKIYVVATVEALRNKYGNQHWSSEKSFTNKKLGYAGKIDLHSENIVVDVKTKEFDKNNLPKGWDEHGMQLGAYRSGLEKNNAVCCNVFVSANKPGLVHIYEWGEKEIWRYTEAFFGLLYAWENLKNYKIGE